MHIREVIKSIDWVLMSVTALLLTLGLGVLASSAYTTSFISPLFTRQSIAIAAGLAVFSAIVRMPYHVWRRYAFVPYAIGVALLIILKFTGTEIRGTVRWIEIFGFQFQPAEFMKIGFIVCLAWLLSRYKAIGLRQVIISSFVLAVPVLFIVQEPDLGSATMLILVWLGVLVFLGLPWRMGMAMGIMGLVLGMGLWQWGLYDYQKERLVTFMNPGKDPLRSGYNVMQSIIALGSGQVLGRGLGHGPQSQLQFLPERHTDFVLASIGEELGFIGVLGVIVLYIILLWRLVLIAQLTQDSFGQALSIGVFFVMLVSFFVSAGMNMGILPVTGIPLPLVSYGGSNIVVTLVLLALAQSVRVHSYFVQAPPREISGLV